MNKKHFLHVGVIPDGNRRWALARGMEKSEGHRRAANIKKFEEIINEAEKLGVKYLSIWGFSTENWKRSEKEKQNLFKIFESFFKDLLDLAEKKDMKIIHFGRKDRLPEFLIREIKIAEEKSKNNSSFYVGVCLDYGGRDEIIRAVNKILKSNKKEVDEEIFKDFLDTKGIPDLDVIIRTSGEKRLSGFMPFQGVYAELFFVKKHFPDFNAEDFRKVIQEFKKRRRRFGGN